MKQIFVEVLNSIYDLYIFLKYSFKSSRLKSKTQHLAFLTKQYHMIEKGMSLPEPRYGFGKEKIITLINESNSFVKRYGSHEIINTISSTLNSYLVFHKTANKSVEFSQLIIDFITMYPQNSLGGTNNYKKKETSVNSPFQEIFLERRSIRSFTDEPISENLIFKAVDLAKHTPSVCNRQAWRVHIYKDEDAQRVLKFQYGNAGIKNIVNVAIITCDVACFTSNERNQVNIDAGMFSMSLLLSLKNLGIETCALNACTSFNTEIKLKKTGNIPENEKVVMFIAFGYANISCNYAISNRYNTESFLSIH